MTTSPTPRPVTVADLLAAGTTYSFEFFPPRTDEAEAQLTRTLAQLEPLQPSFVSITYGAPGRPSSPGPASPSPSSSSGATTPSPSSTPWRRGAWTNR